ncbi:7-carboxy-7-deazaguanine synthase [Rubritalea halochordaticola]|uniref:7-carboxy-7-deazaguanine synthase n=1 Tax=Rubritalea halochordaticola TaxID=714537 RepID=A0ABP9V0U4_9BACT
MSCTLKLAVLNGQPEIFHTLQGEGVSMGVPSIFIRSSLCNLHCTWCDTDYTWNWEGTPWTHENDALPGYKKFSKADYIQEVTVEEVANILIHYPCKNVILTGGEPLLQQAGWEGLITHLRNIDPDYRFEVETNGTQLPNSFLQEAIDQWNVSPKLSNSGNAENLRLNEVSLAYFASSPKAWFKFVIQNEQDLEELQEIEKRFSIPRSRILLMPEGRDEETLNQRRLWLADLCRDQGYRFSDRLHIQLWGSKRGV